MDLFVFGGKKNRVIPFREAGIWILVWMSCAMLFAGLLWWSVAARINHAFASQKVLEYLTGYMIEESLSVDNMFVFIMIFHYYRVPPEFQRRVLLYGVLGAIVMRLVMIFLGTWLVSKFHWVLYVFGFFLIYSGIQMLKGKSIDEKQLTKNSFIT